MKMCLVLKDIKLIRFSVIIIIIGRTTKNIYKNCTFSNQMKSISLQ